MQKNQKCSICGKKLSWKLSGKGKYYGGSCKDHGFVIIVKNPLLNQVISQEDKDKIYKQKMHYSEFLIWLLFGFGLGCLWFVSY